MYDKINENMIEWFLIKNLERYDGFRTLIRVEIIEWQLKNKEEK